MKKYTSLEASTRLAELGVGVREHNIITEHYWQECGPDKIWKVLSYKPIGRFPFVQGGESLTLPCFDVAELLEMLGRAGAKIEIELYEGYYSFTAARSGMTVSSILEGATESIIWLIQIGKYSAEQFNASLCPQTNQV